MARGERGDGMLKLIKWLVIILILGTLWYAVSFFQKMSADEKGRLKQDLIEAIDSENPQAVTKPMAEKIKGDLLNKKAYFYEHLKRWLKSALGD
jgi:hypothetical protein